MSWGISRWLLLLSISFLMIEGCHSFFVRHSQTGKCISTGTGRVYFNSYAKPYWAVMDDNCFNDTAQFRFLKSELLHRISSGGSLGSHEPKKPTNRYKGRLIVYQGTSVGGRKFENLPKHELRQTDAGSLYLHREDVCAQPSDTTIYLEAKTYCDREGQKFTFGSVSQYNSKMKDVNCSPVQRMVIKRADYGDFNNSGTFDIKTKIDATCSMLTNCQVKSRCGGHESCELTLGSNLLPSEYCPDTSKEIYTEYTCVRTSNVALTGPKVRLSESPTKGLIEVEEGIRLWRKVDEKNWDKNRQKMLCEYLGFSESSGNSLQTRNVDSGEQIASGDLICYNGQSAEPSCCIHLETSTTTSQVDLPYVTCQLCDKPLLQDKTKFPDKVFSGSGGSNSYKEARFSNDGWCATNAGYLLIDLQEEYHITRIVILGDKDQTRYSASYSLKYSHHDKKLVDGSTIELTGNKNFYQASSNTDNIYNVRYMKIQSTESASYFCVRIELCGKVQSPAAVTDIASTPSDFSVDLSWTIPGPKASSYITHFIIYLNGAKKETISRQVYGNRFTLSELLPYTTYTVGVVAQDGNSDESVITSTTFRTKQAEPVKPVAMSHSSLKISIEKTSSRFKELMVIVQMAASNPTNSQDIKTDQLKPYQANTRDPYITAYLKTDELPLDFVIGDGKEYNSKSVKYVNQPLVHNSNYIVFLRFFEKQDSYYSTKWSTSVKTMEKPPAPKISFTSTAVKKYRLSWSQPSLPDGQSVLKFYLNYSLSGGPSTPLNVSNKEFIDMDVGYEQKYTFEALIQTEAGRSDLAQLIRWTQSEALAPPKETSEGFIVTLKKPGEEQEIKTVALVLLQLRPDTSPTASQEDLKPREEPPSDKEAHNVAFIATKLDITDFQGDTIEIALLGSKKKRRRKRESVPVYALTSNATYSTAQMNIDKSGKRIWSRWSEPFTFRGKSGGGGSDKEGRDDGGGATGAAVGASLAVVVIVVAIVLGTVIFLRKRRKLKGDLEKDSGMDKNYSNLDEIDSDRSAHRQPDAGIYENSATNNENEGIYSNETGFEEDQSHSPVPVKEFAHYVNELKANNNTAFQSQYDDLPTKSETSWEVAKRPFNKKKNRYGNIVTYDHSRVVLSGDEKEDYINASFMDGIKTNSFIASQGPKKATVNDMWRMVWEQRCYSIVMVTSLIELGKPKCEKYWPDKGTEQYGDIEVTLMKTVEFACHVTHTLRIKKDEEEREVRHYYFLSWPDHGVPKYPTQLLAFRRHFRTAHLEQSGPIVVHCSAGVGRTGVFLAIDMILEKLEKGLISSIDVFGEVCAMRERRMNMIQTLEQYIFVHDAILETILCGMNEVDSTKLNKEVESLKERKASGMTGFEERFKRLSEVSPKLNPEECSAGLLEGNSTKNRNKNIYPAEVNRVCLQYIEGEENSDYINAVFVHGYLGRNYFIATQSPLPNTIKAFWRMVRSHKSSTIVLLNNVKEGTSFPLFWPTTRGKPTQYGSLTVQLDSESESADGIWTRKFILSPYPDLSDGQVVNIFQYTKWQDHCAPANADGVIELTLLVEKSRQSHGQGPVIVTCSDGAGRTGTYIAISNLLERMKIEQAVDVFQAIKITRGVRPQFVESAEQYRFCYDAMIAYLDAFSEYSNFE